LNGKVRIHESEWTFWQCKAYVVSHFECFSVHVSAVSSEIQGVLRFAQDDVQYGRVEKPLPYPLAIR
jgi:hypothetical protein